MNRHDDHLARTVRRQRLEIRLLALLVLFVSLLPSGFPLAIATILLMAAGKHVIANLTAESPDEPGRSSTPPARSRSADEG